MPELPEVEVVGQDLARELVGARLTGVTVSHPRSVRRVADVGAFVDALRGRVAVDVARRGKYLLVALDDGAVLVIHLRMSGQLLWATDRATPRPKHTHVVIDTDRGELRFVDPRTFGELFVAHPGPNGAIGELRDLGIEPLDTSCEKFAVLLRAHSAALKPFLMDQRRIAGIGNIYSDEILFRAGLRWDRRTNSLSDEEIVRLYDAMVTVLRAAIAHRGSSLADAQYVDIYGDTGGYAAEHQVHAREGEPCPNCGRAIVRAKVAGRSTYFCETCQH